MRRLLLVLAMLASATAWAQVPLQHCTAAGSDPQSCTMTVAAHHLIATATWSPGDSLPLSYSDTLGNSVSHVPLPGCDFFTPCPLHIAFVQAASISFAAQSFALYYISTGSFSGSVTFTVQGGGISRIYAMEYGQDFIGLEAYVTGPSTDITTTGASDLLVTMTADSGVASCTTITPAPGMTMEFSQSSACYSLSDRAVPPGTYMPAPTLSGITAVPVYDTIAFGVGSAPTAGAPRHRIIE